MSPGSLGAETARVIAARSPRLLILASRDQAKIQEVIATLPIKDETRIMPLPLDLGSFASVRAAAANLLDRTTRINVMIQTAGVMAVPAYTLTPDGIESTFAINHLGHFLLTALLKPALISSTGDSTRIVTYTSAWHKPSHLSDINFEDGKLYEKWAAYSNSKGCNILFAVGLAQRFGNQGIEAFAVEPGVIVTTSLSRSVKKEEFVALGWTDEHGNMNTADLNLKSVGQGAATGVIAAFDPSIADHNGSVLRDAILNNSFVDEHALDKKTADQLWSLSEKLIGIEFK